MIQPYSRSPRLPPIVMKPWTSRPRSSFAYAQVVMIERNGLLLIAVPLVDGQRPADPGAAVALGVLFETANVIRSASLSGQSVPDALSEYMRAALPFGKPTGIDAAGIVAMKSPTLSPKTPDTKQLIWRLSPSGSVSRGQMHMRVVESVRSAQYDSAAWPDLCEIHGVVEVVPASHAYMPTTSVFPSFYTHATFMLADLPSWGSQTAASVEGVPELTVSLSSTAGLDSVTTHACVNMAEAIGPSSASKPTHRMRFVPPTQQFVLCSYQIDRTSVVIPIRGFFQLKRISATAVRLLVQLKFELATPPVFDRCEVVLPFFGRGKITSCESTPTSGNASINPNRDSLIWSLGTRCPDISCIN